MSFIHKNLFPSAKAAILALSLTAFLCATSAIAQNRYEALGRAFSLSETTRHPQAWQIEYQPSPKWTYTIGLELSSMRGFMTDNEWVRYARSYADTLISDNGRIRGYKQSNFKLDDINSGKLLFTLYDLTGEAKYKATIDTLHAQIARQPRTPEGGMWHKAIYPNQMWLDGQYMALPFCLEYAKRYGTKEELDEAYHFVSSQIELVCSHTFCKECRLYHHAWDSSRKMAWADQNTGASKHAWGRAEGWLMMALVDCLDIYYDGRVPLFGRGQSEGCAIDPLIQILNNLTDNLLLLQDPTTGTWQQVLDCTGEAGNYQETTCSSMFAYAMLKGCRIGAFQSGKHKSQYYKKAGRKALDGIIKHFVSNDSDGLTNLHNCCSVAGLSDTRNGSYEYYLSEKIVDNDPKGIGPLLMALKEMSRK